MAKSASAFLDDAPSAASFLDEAPAGPSPYADVITTRQQLPGLTPGFERLSREQALAQIEQDLKQPALSVPIGVPGFSPVPGASLPIELAQPTLSIGSRVIPPLVAAALIPSGVGIPLSAAIIGGAGSLGSIAGQAQEVEAGIRPSISGKEALVEGGISAIPAAPITRIGSPLLRGGIRALEGGAIGTGQDVAMRAVRGEEQNLGESLKAGAFGTALAGPFAALELAKPAIPKSAQILAEPQTKTPSIANVATEVASQTPNSPYALQTQLNNMTESERHRIRQLQLEEAFAGLPPKSAEESATVLAGAPELPPSPLDIQRQAQAAEARGAREAEAEAKRLSQVEGRIQSLVDELAGGDAVVRAQILGRRRGLTSEQFLDALEGTADFRRAPQRQPDVIAEEIARGVPGSEQAGRIVPAELGVVAGVRDASEAERAAAGMVGVTPEELAARRAGVAMTGNVERPLAPVEYVGIQEGLPATATRPAVPDIEIFNLTEDIPGHPAGSTVSRQTLEAAGFEVPTTRGGSENASQVESPVALGEQSGGTPRAGGEGGPGVEPGNQGQKSAGDFLREGTLPESPLGSERGSISPAVMAPLGGGVAGAITGTVVTERQPGESEQEFQARRLRNAGIGAVAGAGLGTVGALAMGARGRRTVEEAGQTSTPRRAKGPKVDLPEGNVRQTAEKVIENRAYPEQLRQTLADDPDILYEKFALNDLAAKVRGATIEQLQAMSASADIRDRIGAIIELGNRYSVSGEPEKAAQMYSAASQHLTNPAQLIGLGKLVRSPQAMVDAVQESLKPLNRKLAKPQSDELLKLATEKIKAEQALELAERRAQSDFSTANEGAWRKAQRDAAAAAKSMDEYVHQVAPESWGTILSKIVQGNLLTPLSLSSNIFGNLAFQPFRRLAASIGTAIDAIYSPLTNKPRAMARGIPLPGQHELEAAADGVKVAAKELIYGPSTDSYIKSEVQRGFRPFRSLAQAFTGKGAAVQPDGTIALNDRVKRFVEGTLGIAPEVMFRFLNLGDKPFRRAAQAELLMEQAKLKGLKGRDLVKFMEFPDKATQELLDTEGRRAIFAQENKGVRKLNQFLDHGMAEMIGADKIPALKEAIKLFARLNVPFRQFPINYVTTALSFVAPELGVAKALYYGSKGNRRRALTSIGEAALGTMMYGAAAYLWDKGLISEPTAKEPKKRSVQYDQMGPQRLNVSGLERALAGGDPSWKSGDTTMDWGKTGMPAPVFYVYTRASDRDRSKLARVGAKEVPDTSIPGRVGNRIGDYLQMAPWALDQSMLSGTASFLEAIKEAPDSGPLHSWTRNMFRAVTSIAVPNSIEALARAEYQYIPELKGETLADTLKNTWDFKTFQLPEADRKGLKRDLWGDPIPRTPEGKNPYIHQFVDVTGSAQKSITPWKKPLLELYDQTESPDVYPTPPGKNITIGGNTVQLKPDDYEKLQQLVGLYRKRGVEIVTGSPAFQNAQTPEQKIYLLDKMYDAASTAGRNDLLQSANFRTTYPELFGAVVAPEESRIVDRNLPARARARVQQETR